MYIFLDDRHEAMCIERKTKESAEGYLEPPPRARANSLCPCSSTSPLCISWRPAQKMMALSEVRGLNCGPSAGCSAVLLQFYTVVLAQAVQHCLAHRPHHRTHHSCPT